MAAQDNITKTSIVARKHQLEWVKNIRALPSPKTHNELTKVVSNFRDADKAAYNSLNLNRKKLNLVNDKNTIYELNGKLDKCIDSLKWLDEN
ncbi:hypothetical protein PACTADRAFT_48351 [Pachysolen tannophilus NRRL Y-2460]|uniref:Uncharacterized protein n=1 Tax=Pachysolen tannophilus NRRL Y-2460 TaxID=669874 RepID=A0A1E4U3Q0_PACTA|nr:hypothetical protein PACTADRAFT_48351 [Pachysolen tannophilus NRRL Y-2460]